MSHTQWVISSVSRTGDRTARSCIVHGRRPDSVLGPHEGRGAHLIRTSHVDAALSIRRRGHDGQDTHQSLERSHGDETMALGRSEVTQPAAVWVEYDNLTDGSKKPMWLAPGSL